MNTKTFFAGTLCIIAALGCDESGGTIGELTDYEGCFTGSWKNDTLASEGSASLRIAKGNSDYTATLTLGGNALGLETEVPTETLQGSEKDGSIEVSTDSNVWGALSINFGGDGIVRGSGSEDGTTTLEIDGSAGEDAGSLSLNYTLFPSEDNESAGSISLARVPCDGFEQEIDDDTDNDGDDSDDLEQEDDNLDSEVDVAEDRDGSLADYVEDAQTVAGEEFPASELVTILFTDPASDLNLSLSQTPDSDRSFTALFKEEGAAGTDAVIYLESAPDAEFPTAITDPILNEFSDLFDPMTAGDVARIPTQSEMVSAMAASACPLEGNNSDEIVLLGRSNQLDLLVVIHIVGDNFWLAEVTPQGDIEELAPCGPVES